MSTSIDPTSEIVRRLAEREVECPCLNGGGLCEVCEARAEEFSRSDECPRNCLSCDGMSQVPRIPGLRKECQFCFGEGVVIGLHRTFCTPCEGTGWQPVEPDTALRVCLEWAEEQGWEMRIDDNLSVYPSVREFSLWVPQPRGMRRRYAATIEDYNVALAVFEAVEQVVTP